MDLATILTLVGCFAAVIAVTIGLFLHLANKIDTKIDSLQAMVYSEMKQFHGRLCSLETKRDIK